MIDFETPAQIERQVQLITMLGEQVMRPIARYYDEHESERPWDYINMIWQTVRSQGGRTLAAPAVECGNPSTVALPSNQFSTNTLNRSALSL